MKDTHPIELMLVAAIAACTAIAWALRTVLVPLVALALTLAGWRPAAAAAPAAGPVVSAAPAPEPIPATPVAALRKQARPKGRTQSERPILQRRQREETSPQPAVLAGGSSRVNRGTTR